MATITVPGMFLTGTHAARPAASAVGKGTLYACSDHDLVYQSDGSAWTTWLDATGSAGSTLTTKGDLLTRDASALARLGVGTDGQVLTADSAQTLGIKWAAAGGGGVTREYLGHTGAVGTTTETAVANRHYLKKITPTNACDLLSVQVHVKGHSTSPVTGIAAMLYEDNAGNPRTLLAVSIWRDTSLIFQNSAAGQDRWLAIPLNYALAASTSYWIAFFAHDTELQFTKTTTTGTDRYFTESGNWIAEPGRNGAVTTTTDDYDIRARVIR